MSTTTTTLLYQHHGTKQATKEPTEHTVVSALPPTKAEAVPTPITTEVAAVAIPPPVVDQVATTPKTSPSFQASPVALALSDVQSAVAPTDFPSRQP